MGQYRLVGLPRRHNTLCSINKTMAYAPDIPLATYQAHGYDNREHYLDCLREDYGTELVNVLIGVLPQSEDFDGLIVELEDNFGLFDE